MAKVSFKSAEQNQTATTEGNVYIVEASVEPANAVVKSGDIVPDASAGFVDDDALDPSDVVLPRLAIAQRVGDLGATFAPGSIVLDAAVLLAAPPEKEEPSKEAVELVVIGFQPTVFVERVPGGGRGAIVRTEAEVHQLGGTLDYQEHVAAKRPLFQRQATALVAVRQPKPDLAPEHFPFEVEGVRWTLALWTMRGTSYTHGARHIKTARKLGHLRNGYRYGKWELRSRLRKYEAGAAAYIPVLRPAGQTSEEFRKIIKDLVGF